MLKKLFPKSIYIHLPFCKTKCPYCDFASFTERNQDIQSNYLTALKNEIRNFFHGNKISKEETSITSIFFGGGTPSIHSGKEIQSIIDLLNELTHFTKEIEITMEANPGTINLEKLYDFKEAGVNRLSIGAQTFNQNLLDKLARGHTVEETFEIIELIKKVNFKSWSFDLIYGLPKQTLSDLESTIKIALEQGSPHISAYALSIETNTPFGDIYKSSEHQDLAQEDELLDMYQLINNLLKENQLNRYEISNWAKPGHECKHNLTYWRAEEYFAFGLSAHGYFNSIRFSNTRDLEKYIETHMNSEPQSFVENQKQYIDFKEIKDEEKLEEELLLKLRLKEGIELNNDLKQIINPAKLEYYLTHDYLEEDQAKIRLTDKAFFVSNHIIADLLSIKS